MKKLLLLTTLIAICILSGCKKESKESGAILRGYKDSMDRFNIIYANGKISASFWSSGNPWWNFQYKENYVRASMPEMIVEYFLNDLNHPNRISKVFLGTNNEVVGSNDILFYYKVGTDQLDSVVSIRPSNWKAKVKYVFTYTGNDITQLSEQEFYIDGTKEEKFTSYTYDSSPNVFRATNPLLYIYTNPSADLHYHNFLFYFPKIFSSHTFSTYTIYSGGEGKLNYTLNRAGKITEERYDRYGYGYKYFYE